jgi:hypothetical protein
VETFAQLVGDLVDLFALIHLDGLLRGIEDDPAVLASSRMRANLFEQPGAKAFVKIIG